MRKILSSIKNRFDNFSGDIAQAIEEGNWKFVAFNAGRVCIVGGLLLALLLLALALLWKLLGTLLGKVLMSLVGGPLILYILCLSYKVNKEDTLAAHQKNSDSVSLEAWAESVYEYVRDAIFIVLRTMSDYTAIVRPTSPGTVELPNGISIRDGYAVFSFFARVNDTVDISQLKRELTRTLGQMLRAHELKGISSDLVRINGAYYCPLQVFDIVDFGDSINVSVVFATEKTIQLVHARKMLHLESPKVRQSRKKETPYDDEL